MSFYLPTDTASSYDPGSRARFVLRLVDPGSYDQAIQAEQHFRKFGYFPQHPSTMPPSVQRYLRAALPGSGVAWNPFEGSA